MRRHLLAVPLLALAAPAQAEEMPVVVELYTSQGCSSCPPADAILTDLARMDGVIALALHVDYWDYIGWPDSFAREGHTRRQHAYARAAGEHMVYTPQMIFNGTDHVIGGDAVAVMEQLQDHARTETSVDLEVTREGGALSIRATAGAPVPPLVVQVVRYLPHAAVTIEGGENAGHTLDYANIVTDWRVVGEWTGEAELSLDVEAPGDEPVVVILQEEGPGAIRAAARLD